MNTLSRVWYLLERPDITALIHWKDSKMKGKRKSYHQRWDLTWKLRWRWREMWRHREGKDMLPAGVEKGKWQEGRLHNLEVKFELEKLYLEGHFGLGGNWRCLLHSLQGFPCLLIVSCTQREMVVGEKLNCPLPYVLQRPSVFFKSPQTQTVGLVHNGVICI